MRPNNRSRQQPAVRVMRKGKTRRDRESGAWQNHRTNQASRRLDHTRAFAER